MAEELEVSFDEVLAEIERLNAESPDGFTVAEMSKALGNDRNWCRVKLATLIETGKAQCSGKAKRTTIDGRTCWVPVYSIIK